MRRGVAGGAPLTRGAKDSSNGKARPTPVARRNVRRVCRESAISFSPKCFTLDDLVNQGAEAILPGAELFDNLLDGILVGQLEPMPGGINEQALGQRPRDLVLVLEQEFLEP